MNFNNYYGNNEEYLEVEKENIGKRITGDKKKMAQDLALIGGSVLLTGVSIFGVCYLGPDILKAYLNDEVITTSFRIREALLGTSFSGVIIGGFCTIPSTVKIKRDFKDYKFHKGQLKEINTKIEKEKEKVLTR